MRSIKEIFVVGHGPSSSHTMGPANACDYFVNKYKTIKFIKVILFGSLAKTGKGHLTDYVIDLKLKDIPHEIIFDNNEKDLIHPNLMKFEIILSDNSCVEEYCASIGGGTIITKDNINEKEVECFPHNNLSEIIEYCNKSSLSLIDYVFKYESNNLFEYLKTAYEAMEASRIKGISSTGVLPGDLKVVRKAHTMYENMLKIKEGKFDIHLNVSITSFAVSEENAAGGIVCIAPTCGSAGVIPGVITYLKMLGYNEEQIIKGMAVAGLIGIIAKTNASISGAECGCQAEIGVASAMGAALITAVLGKSNEQIEQAAEIAMEHSLGLTCDPVNGYVQIPCIERCAMFALKAIDAAKLADVIPSNESKISFDQSLNTMYLTGKDLPEGYRETSTKGLARLFK